MSKHEHIKQFEIETDAVKVLRRAREMVESGWCKGLTSIETRGGRIIARCTVSALSDAYKEIHPNDYSLPNIEEELDLFIKAIGCLNNDVPRWNDAAERTKSDVLAAFDRAIRIAS